MSPQLIAEGTAPRSTVRTTSRATLRTRPFNQRILIRSWEYIPAFRIAILTLRLLAALVLVVSGIALLSTSNGWGLFNLAAAFAVLPFSFWVFTTAAKGWPAS
jgi:hypothetical protein